jgi:lysophospholipase
MAAGQQEGLQEREGAPALFWRWHPSAMSRATIVVVHGLGEHSGRYGHVFDTLNAHGYSCLAIDLRGFGQSGGPRACLHSFEDYLDDVDAGFALARCLGEAPARLLLGHSMGGLIAARYAQERGGNLAGIALSSPGLAILGKVALWKHGLGVVLSRLLPRFSLPTEIDPSDLSHDRKIVEALTKDPLAVGVISARLYTELRLNQATAIERADKVPCPLLLQAADPDQVVDVAGTRRFLARLEGVEVHTHFYPGLYHEIFNETTREAVLGDLTDWLDAQELDS